MLKFIAWLVAVAVEKQYFGWHFMPTSTSELICDLVLLGLAFLLPW
jgi:hypothetical protein